MHYGTDKMLISDDTTILDGHYYSGRDRNNYGSI